jgi:polyisoprenoid-binding protein YceI
MAFRTAAWIPRALLPLLLAGAAPAKVYEALKGESTLSYRLKHPMHTVHGITREFSCAVELSEDTAASRVEVSADVRTFDSGNPSRDDHALEAIKARRHPRVSFASDSARRDGGLWRIHGRLTFAGQTRPVAFTVVPKREAGRIRIAGGFAIRLGDFGVKRPSLLFVPAEDSLRIRFDLVARDE